MNYKSLANKGRYGDSQIRNVAGRKSHVNKKEAGLIDLYGMLGESLVQRKGAGTRNPMTGMPEYHAPGYSFNDNGDMAFNPHDDSQHTHENTLSGEYEWGANAGPEIPNIAATGTGYTDGEFDPTSQDFRTLVGETGDFSQLNEGYGFEEGDTKFFDKPNMEQLGFIDEEFDISQANIGIGRDTLTENLRSARSSYDTGVESSNLQTGRSLTANKQQGDLARSRSNLVTSGTIDTMQKTTSKGIWQDYNQQQKALSNQITSARSAFGIGQQSLDNDMASADLSKRRGISSFWEGLESDYYTMAGNLLGN